MLDIRPFSPPLLEDRMDEPLLSYMNGELNICCAETEKEKKMKKWTPWDPKVSNMALTGDPILS